jgi:hypothetical protein
MSRQRSFPSFGREDKQIEEYVGVPLFDEDVRHQAKQHMLQDMYSDRFPFLKESMTTIARWHNNMCFFENDIVLTFDAKENTVLVSGIPSQYALQQCWRQATPIIAYNVTLLVKGETEGHANMLIVNRFRKTIEHFEPLGNKFVEFGWFPGENNYVVETLKQMVAENKIAPQKYKWIDRFDICPAGAQTWEDEGDKGYCMLWSLWFLHIRLSNPRSSPETAIIRSLLKIPNKNQFIAEFGKLLFMENILRAQHETQRPIHGS